MVTVLSGGTLKLVEGTISGNNVGGYGGGVFVDDPATFSKGGGVIYGVNESTYPNSNTSAHHKGDAVYYENKSGSYYCNTNLTNSFLLSPSSGLGVDPQYLDYWIKE